MPSTTLAKRRFSIAPAAVLWLGACATEAPNPVAPPTLRIEHRLATRWAAQPPLDPRIGPEEVIYTGSGPTRNLNVVRRLVPAGVPAPCPALSDDAVLAQPRDHWLYGVRTPDGQEVLPCLYALVLLERERVCVYHRYPDTPHDTWLPAGWAHSFTNNVGTDFVLANDPSAEWYSGMPLGVKFTSKLPQATQILRHSSTDGCTYVGERRFPWGLSSNSTTREGLKGSDFAASFLRHQDGVLFCAQSGSRDGQAVWLLDTATLAVRELPDCRHVSSWPPPPAGTTDRRGHDRTGNGWHDIRSYVVQPSPNDPGLLWVRRWDGTFSPPPDTAGIVPLITLIPYCETVRSLTEQFSLDDQRYVPVQYMRRVEQFLLAYDLPEGRRWGVANHDFTQLSGPRYSEVLLRPSAALSNRFAYDRERLGPSHWVLARRADDGAWAIGHGHVPDAAQFQIGADPESLIATAERQVLQVDAEHVAHAALAKQIIAVNEAARAAAAERQRREEMAEARRLLDWATANNSNLHGWSAATRLGGRDLLTFALRLGTLEQCQQVMKRSDQDPQAIAQLTAHVAVLRKQKDAAEARARAEAARPTPPSGGGGGIDWAGWRRETMNAQSANQLGLTGEAFSNYMSRHR